MGSEFLLTSLIVVLAPGTGVLYTLAIAMRRGRMPGLVAAIGCTLGIIPHIAAAVLGLAALLHASAVAFTVVKFAGVAYLLYLAWGALHAAPLSGDETETRENGYLAIALKGFLTNVLNPKLSVFFLAFLPQFIAPESTTVALDMTMLGLVFMIMTWIIFSIYGLFAASFRKHVVDRPSVSTWMNRVFAGSFATLGVKLAVTEQ